MTLNLEIPTDLDAQIQAAARAQNTDAGAWLLETARRALRSSNAATASQLDPQADRRARLAALRGSVKGTGPTVDEFLAERAAEGRAEAEL